jgi:hypothetical protein
VSPTLQPGQVFAGYRIEGVAGRGGMGIVYRARQIMLDRIVALKLIAPEMAADEDFRARLERESKVLASIDHPNVITIYEAGEVDGELFMSMRYVEGLDLRSLIAAEGALAPERAARIVAQVAAGLDAAHARGLVHRDVKPANVLIEHGNDSEQVYLSDFGLTNQMSLTSAAPHSGWLGTLDYVAPEQIEARRVDARSDVYALGCVLFQALTGRVPYVRESDAAKLHAHLSGVPPSARELRPELPVELDRVIARAMSKNPELRYPSAGDLGRAAIAAAGGEPITVPERSVATSASAPPTGGRLLGRRRRLIAAAGVAATLLVAAGAAALSGRDHARRTPSADLTTTTIGTNPVSAPNDAATPATTTRDDDAAGAGRTKQAKKAQQGTSGEVRTPPSASSAQQAHRRPAHRLRPAPATKTTPPATKTTPPSVVPPPVTPPPPPPPSVVPSRWSTPTQPDDRFHCGADKTTTSANGSATFQECVIVYRANNGTTYYQSLLSAYYTPTNPSGSAEAFHGTSKSTFDGQPSQSVDCGTATFSAGQRQYCFTATVPAPAHGHGLSATGTLEAGGTANSSGSVSSPTIVS